MVAQAFIPNPNNYPQVNHIDGNKLNNCINNLEWCTNKYNIQHSIKNGLRDYHKLKNLHHKNCKSVNQYDLEGNFIRHWDYISDAAKESNVSFSSIYRSCNKQIKKHKIYIWEYAN